MSVNHTAWLFPASAEAVIAEYLEALVSAEVVVRPAFTASAISTPRISVRNVSVRPFTQDAAIVAHVETLTAITVRTGYEDGDDDAGRDNHAALVASVMGCVMQADAPTGENALPALLNAVAGERVMFSMAAWAGNVSSIDDEARHFVTRIELNTIIGPVAPEPED
jgi:hypothetical protein